MGSTNKRFYWMKLNEDFFDDETIQFIEEQENGIYYSNFYLKLCLKSLRTNGILMRVVGQRLIPYDVKSLARLTGVNADTVAVAMKLFTELGIVEVLDSGEIYMAQINEMVGSETDKAKFMRQKRAREKELTATKNKALPKQSNNVTANSNDVTNNGNNVTVCGNNVTEVLPERYLEYRDKSIEYRDIEHIHCASDDAPHTDTAKPSDNTKQDNPAKPRKREVDEHFDAMWAMYPCKRGKNQVSDKHKRQLMAVRLEDMRKAIDRYVAEKEAAPFDRQWLNGSTWFNGRYLDYINDDYEPPKVTCGLKPSARSQVTQFRAAGEEFDYRALEE